MVTDYIEIRVVVTPDTEEALANALCELGSHGVVTEEGEEYAVLGYVSANERIHEKLTHLNALWADLQHLGLADGPSQISVRALPTRDWTTGWQERFRPVRVTEHLVVTPPWGHVPPRDGQIVVEITPAMAFGTGEHETTQLCLRALEQQVRPGDRVLDVGTGSAVLAITAAKLGAASVTAVDIDDVAVDGATENIVRNQVEGVVRVYHGGIDHAAVQGTYRVIVSNTDTPTLPKLFPRMRTLLDPTGALILSGVLASEGDTIIRSLGEHGFTLVEQTTQGEWWGGIAVPQSA